MMKMTKIFIAAFTLTFTALVSSYANTTQIKSDDEIVLKMDPKKTEIRPSELPSPVKDVILNSEFAKWNVAKVYKITYSENKEKVEYEVHFSNDKKEKQIKVYNKEGALIDG
ncbi:hypothetical protein JMN32_25830 [Fulvivirga sp. 29W222]|uniref:Beta-lactamase-inhibitor-like PepSY-like domain-containing protein n=1 Tax=Fulvivirga marina TaxID=2494733 RepID=A0A937G314_9BACT|nr:hypothetical protein [Fulvivirga marina]MBL6449757.1 hypothetical protein [Fulvivirga marina]